MIRREEEGKDEKLRNERERWKEFKEENGRKGETKRKRKGEWRGILVKKGEAKYKNQQKNEKVKLVRQQQKN